MTQDKYPIDEELYTFQERSNYVFFGIFSTEMILKLLALGVKGYVKDRFNIFDGLIILLGIIEIVGLSVLEGKQTQFLSVFRGFRILRLLKLVKSWKKLQDLLSTMGNTLKDLRNFSVLLLICIITYTLLGLSFFAHKIKFNDLD